jgi:hypothetical protein
MGRALHDPFSPASEDHQTEGAVLALLLAEHTTQLTLEELALVLGADPRRPDPEDDAKRAVRELVGAGLLHLQDRFLVPTRAALYFDGLGID